MGGEGQEVFTDEEKVILGEKEPNPAPAGPAPAPGAGEKPPEGEKTEPKKEGEPKEEPSAEEKQAAESMGLKIENGYIIDDDGTKIPAKRWKGMYRDFQEEKRSRTETERRFNLFRELGAEKYYELYPDEKPEGWKPPEKPNGEKEGAEDLGNMRVQGGPYDGKTLNEVYKENPAYAQQLQYQYLTAKNQKAESEKQAEDRRKQESESEINAFTEQVSKELYGKESGKLSPQEQKKVADTIQGVLDWMGKTRRGGGFIADAYFLMNREGIIADAKTKGGREALEALQKPAVPSVDTRPGGTATGFDAYEQMTSEQLAAKVGDLSEAAFTKFMKEAPESLRKKHPQLPWT